MICYYPTCCLLHNFVSFDNLNISNSVYNGGIYSKKKSLIKYGNEARHKCKHGFPMTKRLVSVPTVICKGNARRFGLRPSGRRNALGTILTQRNCKWASGCSPAMALVFRCNTHTAPNYRVPISNATHDPDCKGDCTVKEFSF